MNIEIIYQYLKEHHPKLIFYIDNDQLIIDRCCHTRKWDKLCILEQGTQLYIHAYYHSPRPPTPNDWLLTTIDLKEPNSLNKFDEVILKWRNRKLISST